MATQDTITLARIEAVAPDQAALNAARKLLGDAKWPTRERDADGRLLWGACQGSGATAYRVTVEVSDLGAKCSCPSRKFPCKHAIALMWWYAEQPERFTEGTVPDWVVEWQGRRRRTAPMPASETSSGEGASMAAAVAEAPATPKDPEQARRQKELAREAREASILRGLDDLDVWIGDQVDRGFGAFAAQAGEQCRLLAQRLVDAKVGGLATQVDALPSWFFRTPDAERHDLLLETLGSWYLLGEAYRRQDALPDALRADVRARIGWTTTREGLLASDAERVSGSWTVLALRRETQPDRLARCETWLATPTPKGPRMALLLDFVPVTAASQSGAALEPGTQLDAELVFHPSATPLRAQVATQGGATPAADAPSPTTDMPAALAGYDVLVARNPWLGAWPLAVRDLDVARDAGGATWAVARDGSCGVPLVGADAASLVGVAGLELYGAFDGRTFDLLAANSVLGPLWSGS